MDRKVQLITILLLIIGACVVFNFSIAAINLQPEVPEELVILHTYNVESTCTDVKAMTDDSGNLISFQTSAPREDIEDKASYIEIGLRNKYGKDSSIDYLVKIISPDNSVKEMKSKLVEDAWSNLHYPKDKLMEGKYLIEYYVEGKKVACDAFGVR
jgi:hypothetical protein